MTSTTKEIIKSIARLIDDKDLPARRIIADYVVLLIQDDEKQEAEKLFDEYFERLDVNKQISLKK